MSQFAQGTDDLTLVVIQIMKFLKDFYHCTLEQRCALSKSSYDLQGFYTSVPIYYVFSDLQAYT